VGGDQVGAVTLVDDGPRALTDSAPSGLHSANVAIVHDYLNQRGGAERVVLEMSDMWPNAPIYTSLYRPGSTFPAFGDREIRATRLNRMPVDRGFRNLLPLYPAAFHGLGEIDADVVVASSSGWAHLARTSRRTLHAIYCHTPARWLYGRDYLGHRGAMSVKQAIAQPVLGKLARLDREAARRADLYIANSENVKRLIRSTYGIEAVVVPPPVDVDRFSPTPRGARILMVTRLLPYKNVAIVVRAATRLGIGLDVVGDGPLLGQLSELAGPSVKFHGPVADEAVVELMERCSAVCVAAEEDFGIVSVEAQAAGKPVIAYGRGGSLETVSEGLTGVFFREQTEESLIAAIRAAEALETSPSVIATHARRFSRAAFRVRLETVLEKALDEFRPATRDPEPAFRPRRESVLSAA